MRLFCSLAFIASAFLIDSSLGIPSYCYLPHVTGDCDETEPRYFYSAIDQRCLPYFSGVCKENENSFLDVQTCMEICGQESEETDEGGSHEETVESIDTTESGQMSIDPPSIPPMEKKSLPDFLLSSPFVMLDNGSGETVFTFANPSSFIQIGPQEISRYQTRNRRSVSLEFRTRLHHALLIYHGIKDRPARMKKYELYVMLDQGQLKVKHLFGDFSTTLVVGKGLSRDKWHQVSVTIDPHERTLFASVDDKENKIVLNGLTEFPLYGAEDEDLDSIIFIGGLQTGTNNKLEVSYMANPFVGCIRNVSLATSPLLSSPLNPIIPLVSDTHNVEEKCLNKCQDRSIPCARDAKCINHYDHVECDCFEARFKGEKCKSTSVSLLTLNGYSYVTFSVYEWMDRVHSAFNRFSLQFKTYADDSILLYAAGELPYHNHVAASIINKKVHISIDFGDGEEIEDLIGSGLTDGNWHILTILHHGKNITVILDKIEKHFVISGNRHHLYIDPDIYIGGGGPILKHREGLNSTNNFVGCLKEVYFNQKSILYELQEKSHQASHHGLTGPMFGECKLHNMVPVTIPFAESGFRILNNNDLELNLKFDFKTDDVFGTLAYSDIRSHKGEGFWELKIVNDEVRFILQPDKSLAEITVPKALVTKFNRHPGSWSSVELKYSNGEVWLKTDKMQRVENFADVFLLSQYITLGTSIYKPHTGFVGCMRKIVIGGVYADARKIVGSEDQIGDIAMDNCQFINPCLRPDVCEHGGKCSVQNGEVTCECSETGYIGKHCHFAIFKRTCEELALLGYTKSGVYKIDIDGNGPYPPSHVKCHFETDASGETKTIVEHNLANETDVWIPNELFSDFTMNLTYREFTPEMLMSLVSQSVQCLQHIKFDCYNTKLALHQYSWFVPADPKAHNVVSIGDVQRSKCPCSERQTCVNGLKCNCDSGEAKWLSDEGFFSIPERLGITQMNFMVPKNLPENAAARITLGPVECIEANTQRYVVTFKTFGSFLEAPGWKSGDLAFSFRTTRSSAILLFMPLLHPQHNSFSVYLTNDHELIFRFVLNGGTPQKVVVRSQRALSGGEWQQVWIDYDLHQVRFQINGEHQMINLLDGQQFGPFEGTMYIAGAPQRYLEGAVVNDGLIGCFRGLVMNGQVVDLYSYMKFHKADIVKDCSPSCDPNPCKNSAICQENWGSFTCQCLNPWAQSGQLCETDINEDGLTFLSQSSYIKRASKEVTIHDPIKDILKSNIYLNLRTYDTSALVLYANDNLNNFVQIHIENGNRAVFTWNEFDFIRQLQVSTKGLSHGKSIQIAVVRNESHTILYVNQDSAVLPIGVSLLEEYHEQPWRNAEMEKFTPPRPFAPINTYYQLFLGGFDNVNALKPANNLTKIPGMLGCLRGLKIGNERIPISQFANTNDVLDGCKMVCDSKPCQNGGVCVEDFQARAFSCDCTYTSYLGINCNEERGANFQGDSFIRRRFKNIHSTVNQIEARFGFSSAYAEDETVLLTVQIPEQKYSLLFAINKEGHFVFREHRDSSIFGATIQYQNFIDSSRHSVYFSRLENSTLFMVDYEEIDINILEWNEVGEKPLNREGFIGEVFIAGVNEAVTELKNFRRFKGCMSNIFVQLYDTEMKPLDEYMGYAKKNPDLVLDVEKLEGMKLGACAAFSLFRAPLIAAPPSDLTPANSGSGGSDWITNFPDRVKLNLRPPEVEKSATVSFNFIALIFAIILGLIAIFVTVYTYRLNKRYKRRILEDDNDDELYFTHRGQVVRYHDPTPVLNYASYRGNESEKAELLSNQEPVKQNPTNNNVQINTETTQVVGGAIDDENAESTETSQNEEEVEDSVATSSSSLNNETLDEKLELEKGEQVQEMGNEQIEKEEDDDSLIVPIMSRNDNPKEVHISDNCRTFGKSPIAIIGGAKYQMMKRTSKDSIISLD